MRRTLCFLLALAIMPAPFLLSGCGESEGERSRYAIQAEYEEGVLSAEMNFSYYNDTQSEINSLSFNLYGNAYREGAVYAPVSPAFKTSAYYGGESFGGMDILEVSPCAGWEIAGEDENVLRVGLEKSVAPGERAQITVSYELRLAAVDHRTGIAERAVNLGNFYPVLCVYEEPGGFYECAYYSNGDPFYSACADYSVTLTADADYVVASSGETVSAAQNGAKKTYGYSLENARDFALVLSREFTVLQAETNGISIAYYYYEDEAAAETLALIERCVTYFEDTFGEYPYRTYAAVQTGFCYGGMEYPGLAMLSDGVTGLDYLYTAVHETAHQWWYAAVGNNQIENGWMDEGLAEYSTLLFFENNPEYGLTREGLTGNAHTAYNAYCSVYSQVFGKADTTMDRKLCDYGEYEYVNIAYNKGMILFDTLRDTLGERKFFSALRRYYTANAGKIAGPEELCTACGNGGAAIVRSFVDGSAVI